MMKEGYVRMSDVYVECLVKAKTSMLARLGGGLLTALAVICVLLIFVFPPLMLFGVIGAVLFGVGAYVLKLFTDLEYEYLYLDKELSVDKIMAKTRRKRVATYHLDRIEILAPFKSYHLDNYRNRQAKTKDYSIGEELKPDRRFLMYYEGGEKIVLSPSEELIKAMKNVAPRKVFSD